MTMDDADRASLDEIELGARAAQALDAIGEQRQVTIAGITITGRRRRPTGERAPLPRQLRASGWFWLVASVSILGVWITIFAWEWTAEWWTHRDLTVLRWVVDLRNGTLDAIAKAGHSLGSDWAIRPMRWAIILALVVYKRWRHLIFGLAAIIVVEAIASGLTTQIGRPRPFVDIIGSWEGYAHPSVPVARLAITLTFAGYGLLPAGRWRVRWFVAGGMAVATLVASRVYLGVDHPTDGIIAGLFGVAIGVLTFRLFVPDEAFPVSYRRGRTAHLDVGGERGRAIRQALRDQLGFETLEVEPVGLAGSGGSTPLKITVAGDPPRPLFAKLYASTHLRADRWYKIGRTILYGSLEDEVRFTSVRRLVEYEDYVLLVMRKAGLPSPDPYGIVEITPEREYLIVTEFLEGATELGEAEVDDAVIDDGLDVVRRMWDAGLAHRDIKPANVMVRDGRVALIDVAFGTVRPSPWRQAVDLANMMMILALRSSPERVYERALRRFAPEDIAEAFAATRGITIPTQSRSAISRHRRDAGVDLIARFRELAPPRELIGIQRWSARRIAMTACAVLLGLFAFSLVIENLTGGGFV